MVWLNLPRQRIFLSIGLSLVEVRAVLGHAQAGNLQTRSI